MLSIAAGVALCVALAAAILSASRALGVGRALDLDVDQLAAWSKRRTSTPSALRRAIGDDSTLAPLALALEGQSRRASPDDPAARADRERACNEALVDLADALDHDDDVHMGALRLAGYATGLAALLTVFEPLLAVVAEREPAAQALTILDAVAIGGGAFVSVLATRRASRQASRRRRTAIDKWVACVLSPGGDEPSATGSRSRSR